MKILFSLVSLFLCQPLFAAEQSVSLSINPSVCAVRYQGDSCELDLNANWQSHHPLSCCLYAEDDQISCWQNQTQALHQFHLITEKEMIITLIDSETEQVLAQDTLCIQAQSNTRYRHRLKMPWSIF